MKYKTSRYIAPEIPLFITPNPTFGKIRMVMLSIIHDSVLLFFMLLSFRNLRMNEEMLVKYDCQTLMLSKHALQPKVLLKLIVSKQQQ